MVKVKLANPGEIAVADGCRRVRSTDSKMKQVPFPPLDTFAPRHIGPRGDDVAAMLKEVGAASLDALIDEAIPASIRLKAPLNLPPRGKRVRLSRAAQDASRRRTRCSAASSASATPTR